MDQTEKPELNKSAKIILFCTIILVVFLSFAMWFMWNNLKELSTSPFLIGAQKTAQVNNAPDVLCTCRVKNINPGLDPVFYFNTTDIWNDQKNKMPFDFNAPIEVVQDGSG